MLRRSIGWTLGCDPEFFFKSADTTVGAEKVIPKDGLKFRTRSYLVSKGHFTDTSKVIIDGVQAELNPAPTTCRAYLGTEIQECFRRLSDNINKKYKIDFSSAQEITKEEMDSLSKESKIFGCSPSLNAQSAPPKVAITDINPEEYRIRTAGGHLHIGSDEGKYTQWLQENVESLIQMYDILVGNTCVLIDRDKNQVERRKTYGRAGEYRVQPHGIEYRTLSNFWLRSYPLMSFVTGLIRMATDIVHQKHDIRFKNTVSKVNIIKAINENNYTLAMHNFFQILPIISHLVPDYSDSYPLNGANIPYFMYFIIKGIDHWWKQSDIIKHWDTLNDSHGKGWESFLYQNVGNEMKEQWQ